MSKFLRRQGVPPPPGVRSWSVRHHQWLNRIHFDQLADQVVVGDHLSEVRTTGGRVEAARGRLARRCRDGQPAALDCRPSGYPRHRLPDRGHDRGRSRRCTALRHRTAIHGLRRPGAERALQRPCSLSRLDHQDWQQSSGTVLGEAAHHARHVPRVQGALEPRQARLAPLVVALAWQTQLRLHTRNWHLAGRIGPQKALTAVPRELADFVWALSQQFEELEVAAAA